LGEFTGSREYTFRLILCQRGLRQELHRSVLLVPHKVTARRARDEIVGSAQLDDAMLYGSDQRVAYPPARVQFDYLRRLRDEPDVREPFDIINRRMLKCSVKAL